MDLYVRIAAVRFFHSDIPRAITARFASALFTLTSIPEIAKTIAEVFSVLYERFPTPKKAIS